MSASDGPRRVHFQSPEYLVERLDAIAELFDKDRTDVLVEAIRDYIEDTADDDSFQDLVAIDILPALKREDSRPPLGYCGLRRGLFSRCEASAL